MKPIFLRPSRKQKKQAARSRRWPFALAGSIAALALCIAQSASAASGTWNGTAGDSLWGSAGNWTGGIPGTGDTAAFNGAAGAGTAIISLGGGVTVSTIVFDTASAAAYTIGTGAVNSQTLTLNNGGAITMTGSVLQDELFNAAILLGTDATAQAYTFTNNSTTNLLTFAGTITGGSGGAAGAKTLNVTGAGNTLISGVIANGGATSVALTKSGAGNLTLRGINTYSGLTTIQGGTLTLDNNTGTGSIAGAALTFSGGGGTFDYLGAAAGSTQAFSGALTFGAGAGNVRSTYGTSGNTGITFGSLAARVAGATGNFVINGGANGTTNKIVLAGQATGFIDQGTFFNGSSYAYYESGGFVRGMNYTGDAGAATTGAGATIGALGGNHVQVTGSISGQTSLAINTLNLSGANVNVAVNSATPATLTLTNGGILKSGGGAAQISGGTVAAGAAELVIRADLATDYLKVDSIISGSGGVTITGAGKVFLDAANTFTGNVAVNGATLAMNFGLTTDVAGPLGAAGVRTITFAGGGTLQLLGVQTYNSVASTKSFVIGTGGGTLNIGPGSIFQTDDAGQLTGSGDLTVTSGGNGIFLTGGASGAYTTFTGNVAINGGIVRVTNVSGLGNTAGRSILVNSGGSLDAAIAAFNPGAGTIITLNGNGVNNTGALQNSQAAVTTMANNVVLASNASVGSSAAGGLALSGVISGGFSLTKVGAGTGAITLSGLNTYTGSTIVNAGTLIADSTTNAAPINSVSGLVFSGSGTFRYTGSGGVTKSMTLNGLTLAGGAGILDINNTGTTTTLTLGTITRVTGGGSVDIRATTGTLGGTSALANFAGQSLVNGIIGGFATVNSGANLATFDGLKNVVAYGAYTDINTNGSVVPNGAANNVRIATTAGSGNITIGAGTTDANTLFQNTVTPVIVDTSAGILRLGSQGGIVTSSVASTTGTVIIGTVANSGTLTAGGAANTAGEIIVNTATANTVTINSVIADNGSGAVSLNMTGLAAGTLSLGGTNTYSGVTTITSGTVQINAPLGTINTAGALGKGSVAGSAADLVINGGTLQLSLNAPVSTDRLFSVGLGNATLTNNNGTATNTLSFTGTGAIGFNGQSGSRTLTLTGTNTGNNLLTPVLGDNGGPSYLTKTGAGLWILAGNNTYTGTTTVSAGTLQVGNGGTAGSLGTGYIAGTGGIIAFNRTDNVTLNNLINGGNIQLKSAATLALNNFASQVTTLSFNGVDGGTIDLLQDVGISNAGASSILATNSGTITATGGGRLLINSTAAVTNGQDWGAANGKTLTISAVIANGQAVSASNNVDIFQVAAGTGVTILTADNTFTGQINIFGNTLQVARIGNQGTAAPVGAGTTIGINGTGGTGLRYTGTGETTDRIISLAGTTAAGFIEQAGASGLLKFTTNLPTPGAGAKTLVLQGSTAGTGEIAGIIVDNSANVNTTAITKAGTGTWTLSAANTYTGATAVNGGALILGNALAAQNSVVTSTVANSATTGLVFGPGIGSFSIGGLGGSQALALTDSASVALTALTIGGTNTSNGVYSGVLSGTANITKTGTNGQTFSGINTYTGKTIITGGTLSINSETSLGANPAVSTPDQLTINGATLSAIANTVFTIDDANRGITIGASGATLDAQAGAVMTVSEAINGGANAITKSGPGVVIFTQANTYGTTTITGGRLILSGAGTVGAGGVSINGGGYVVSGAGAVTVGAAASGSSLIYTQTGAGTDLSSTLTLTAGGTLTVDVVSSAGTVTFANAFGSSSNAGLTKAGLGTLTLQGGTAANNFTGTTTAGAGNLVLDFATVTTTASGVNSSTSPLSFRGGTLTLLGKSATTDLQTFASTALLEGGSTLTATQNTATSLGASLGLISRDGTTNKGTINFVLPTAGNYATTTTNNASGILGGWATVGGTAWAMASGGNIASYAGEVALPATGGVATTNYSYNATTTISGNLVANAIKFTTTGLTIALGTNNLTLSGNSGGLLNGLAAGTISGTTTTTSTGFINAGASGELMVYTNAGSTITISAGIGGTVTSFGLTKSGPGTLSLSNAGTTANNYTGVTTINGGTLTIDALNRLGASTGIVLNGGTLNQTVNFSVTQPITLGLNGGTLNYNTTAGNGGWSSATAIAFLGSGSRTLTLGGTDTGRFGTLSAAIGESGGPTSLVINGGSDTSDFQLSGANSTYTGATTINRGVLRLNAANAVSPASNVTFNGGANRAILEFNATYGSSFTNALGTLPGQVQWLGNGGFSSSNVANFLVNLGGQATPSTVVWNSGGFVPTGSTLQFAQNSANQSYGSGTINFQNPIDLAGASRTIDVLDNGGQNEAILSGVISGAAGSILNKTGLGNLTLSADNTASANVGVTVAVGGGSVIFSNVNAVPGTTGATVTITGGSVVLTGSTNPLAAIGSRIVTTSAGSILLDTNSSATLDFSSFSALSLGAYNATMGQSVIFTGSINPNSNTYRLGTGRSTVFTAAVTGNTLINYALDQGRNSALVLPVTNQLPDGGGARSLVVGSGATYITSYNTFTGGTKVGQLTGQVGNVNLTIGNDAALGAGLIQFSPTGTTAGVGFVAGTNGDHIFTNNVTVGQAGNWVSSGNLASDAVTNSGAMTYAGTTTLTGAVAIFARTNASVFLGNIAASGTISINNTVLFLTTPAGATAKTFAQQTSIVSGGTLVIDANTSLGGGTNTLAIATTGGATLRIQPGTSSPVTLTGRSVTFTATFAPTFDIPGSPVTATTSNLILPGVVSGGATTAQVNKIGLGTLTFRGLNTWSSTAANGLQIYGGTVLVDSATAPTALATNATTTALTLGTGTTATAATLGGGGTFSITAGGNSTTQTFTNLNAAGKDNAINLSATGAGSATLNFNSTTFNRGAVGGSLAITMSGTTAIGLTVAGGVITTGNVVANQIVLDSGNNAYAYVNGADWAARNGSNQIVALGSTGAGTYTANTATVLAGNADMSAGNTALATGTTITSLRFNTAAATTLDLSASNLVTGGILVGTGIGANNQIISASGAGALQGIASKDLVLINANTNGDGVTTGLLTISAPIIDNTGATALTKSGPGTVVLTGNNSFTSSIYLNGGVLSVATAGTAAAANPLGQMASGATNLIMNGGTLRYTGAGSTTTDRGATFNSYSAINVDAGGGTPGSGTFIMTGAMNGIAAVPGLLQKTGAGALNISGAADNPNLSVLVTAGTLNLDKGSTSAIHAVSGGTAAAALIVAGGTVKITGGGGDQIFNGSAVVVNGGVFDFNGQSETFDALGGTTGTVTNTGASVATLTLGDPTVAGAQANNSANTPNAAAAGVAATGLNSFGGIITDDGVHNLTINKSGPGMQILTGTSNTYHGDTIVTSGVLRLGATNVLPSGAGKGNVSLVGNTVIFGLTVPGTLDMGGFDQAINGLTGTAGSIVTNTPPTTVSANQTNTLLVGNNDQSSQFDGVFQDGYVIARPGGTPTGFFGFVAVDKVGAGVLMLTGTSTNTGTVTIDNGRIDLNNATGNALSTNVTINTGGTLKLLASNQIADGNSVTTAGGTFDLNGRNETVGVVLTGGSIIDGSGGGSLSSGSAFDLQAGIVSAKLSGTSGLNKTTAGTVTLGGAQTHNFGGATSISAGTLVLAGGASISASSGVALTGTGRFYVNGSTAAAVPVSVATGTTLGGTGTINGTVTVADGKGVIEAGQSGAGSLTVNNLTFSGAGKFLVYNIDTGASASLVNVTGTLSGSATPGSVAINATNSGSLANGTYKLIGYNTIANTSAFTTGTITGLGGRQTPALDFGISTPNFISLTITGDAPKWNGFTGASADSVWHVPAGGAPTNWKLITGLTATDFQANDQVLFDDSLDLVNNPTANAVTLSEGNVSPASVTFNNVSVGYTLSGAFGITGGTSLVKNGTGTLTINNANSFTGGVVINAGVVKLGNAGAIGTGNALLFGASAAAGTKLQLFGFDATVTGLSTNVLPGTPVIENGSATTHSVLTVNLASGTNTFAGVFQNGGAATLGLTKQGGGTLILTGSNSATGGNTISVGTLQIGSGGTGGVLAGDTSAAASTNLDFNRSDASTYGGAVTGAGTVTVEGGGTLSITGDVGHSGGTTIAATTTLQIGNGGATGALSGAGTITDNGTLAFNRTGSTTIQAPIGGTGNLSVGNGTTVGTLILTGNNSYAGTTTITGNATLQVGNATASGSLGTAASITDNGTFAYGRSDAQTYATVFNGTGAIHILSGTLTLTGDSSGGYSGGTTIDSGAALIVGNVAGTSGAIPGVNATGTGNIQDDGSLTFRRTGANTWDNQISGAGSVTIAAGNWTFTNANAESGLTTVATGATLTIGNGGTTGTIGTGAVSDTGGLIFNRTNTYTLTAANLVTGAGPVTLANSGPVVAVVDGQFNTTGVLVLGGAQGSTTASSLDLTNANSTFGSLNVQTNTATANTITIGAGKTLTLTGGVAGVVTIGANSAASTTTNLNFVGGGNLAVTRSGGTFQVGGATGATNWGNENVNMSSLTNFTADLGATGVFRVGAIATVSATATEILTGAANNTITAATLGLGDTTGLGGGAAAAKVFNLGSGTNAINVNTISIGATDTQRGSGLLQFAGAGGTLTVRSATGATGVTNLNLVNNASGTGTTLDGKLLLAGHSVDASFNNIVMSARSAGTTNGSDATLSFDTGTLTANTLSMVARTGVAFTSGASTGTVNLGGGTAILGAVTMVTNSAITAVSTGAATATLNINGGGTTTLTSLSMANDTVGALTATSNSTAIVNIGTVSGAPTVALGAVTMATNNSASTTGNTASGTINIAAGSVTAASINMANTPTAAGTTDVATAILNITGGSLTLSGNITTGNTGPGTRNTTLTVNGGTLDMGGFSIGSATAAVGSGTGAANFQSGTLKNLLELNGGTTPLTKSATGTLILSGTNSYTGGTAVNNGTLLVNSTAGTGTGLVTVNGGTTTRGTLGGTGGITGGVTLATNGATAFAQGATINPGTVGTAGTLAITTSGLVTNNFSNLTFDLNSATTAGGGVNDLISTDVLPVIGATTQVNINTLGTLSLGSTYTLINGYTGTLANFGNLTLNAAFTGVDTTHTGSLQNNSGSLQLFVVNSGFSAAYWNGSIDVNWNSLTPGTAASNWRDAATGGNDVFGLPSSATDVHFYAAGAGSLGTTLGQNFSIKTLTFDATATTDVSISGNTLTITPGTSSTGLTVVSGAGNVNITSAIVLGATQTWTTDSSGKTLTVAAVTNGAFDATFSGAGNFAQTGVWGSGSGGMTFGTGFSGTATLSQANTFTGALAVNGGTVVGTSVATALGAGALSLGGGNLKLTNLTGTNLNFARNTTVTANSTITSDVTGAGTAGNTYTLATLGISGQTLIIQGGANVNSGTAGVTFSGTTTFSTANPTFTINNPAGGGTTLLTLGAVTNNPFTATIKGSGSLAQTGVWGAGAGGITLDAAYTGTVTLSQANTFTGPVTINGGALTATVQQALGLGTGTATVATGSTLNLTNTGTATYTGLNTVVGGGIINVTLGTVATVATLGGDYSGFTGTTNVGVGGTGGKVSLNGADNAAATVNVVANGTVYISAAVTKNAALTLNGGDTGESLGQLRLEASAIWAGPVTLAGPITGTGDFTIGGNTTTGIISGNIGQTGGAQALSKGGSGIIILSGTNTYTGATTIAAGTLQIGNGSTTGTLNPTGGIVDNATLTLNRTNTLTQSTGVGNISGTGAVIKNGAGTLVLDGTNTFTGAMTVNAGAVTNPGNFNNGAGTTTIASAAATSGYLYVPTGGSYSSATYNVGGNATGIGSVIINGGTVNATTASTAAGYIGGNAGYGGFFLSNGGSFAAPRFDSGASAVATAISVNQISSGTFTTNGDFILIRSGHGELTITGGSIVRTVPSNTIALGELGIDATMNVAGGIVDNTGQTVQFGRVASSVSFASLNLNAGSLITNGIAATAANITGAGAARVNFNGGELKASAANTTFLPSGVTAAYSNAAFGTYAGGAVVNTNGFNITFAKPVLAPTGNGIFSATVGAAGSGYIGAPLVQIVGDGTGATGYAVVDLDPASGTFGQVQSIVITNPGIGYTTTPTVNLLGGGGTGASATAGAPIANASGGLVKNGAGILTLGVAGNTYTGGTTINAGTVALGANDALADAGNVTISGGTFDAATFTDTVATVSLQSGAITGSTGVLTSSGNYDLRSGTVNFTGTGGLAGTGNVNKTTSGTVTLTNNGLGATFANAVNVNGGTLAFSTSAQLGSAAVTNTIGISGGTLSYTGATAVDLTATRVVTIGASHGILDASQSTGVLTISGGVTGTGNLTKTGPGTVIITGTTNLGGAQLTVSDGTLRAGFGTNGVGTITIGATGNLDMSNSAIEALVLKSSAGALTLNGGAKLGFELTSSGTNDSIAVGATGTAITGGTITLNFTGTVANGTYTLLSSALGGLNGATYVLGTAPSGFNYTINRTDFAVSLAAAPFVPLYWTGSEATPSWATINGTGPFTTNWSIDSAGASNAGTVPLATHTVVFSATTVLGGVTSITTTLDGSYTIDGLQFIAAPAGVTDVTINRGTSGTLTLAPVSTSGGILVAANAGNETINVPLVASTTQTWNIDGTGASLTIGGANASVAFNAAVTKSGGGALTLASANTGAGGFILSAGTVNINNNTALGTGTFTIGSGTTIDNTSAGLVTLTNNNVQNWNGGFVFTGTQDLNLGTGAVTLGASGGVLTSTAGKVLTVGGAIDDGTNTFGLAKLGAGTLVLNGSNGYDGLTDLQQGTLTLAGNNSGAAGGVTMAVTTTLNLADAAALGTGTFTINGGALDNTKGVPLTLSTNNAQSWNGSFTFTGSNNLNLGAGAVTLGASPTVNVNANTLTAGAVGDGVSVFGITKDGAGTLELGGVSTYKGATLINRGTLRFLTGTQNLSAISDMLTFGAAAGSTSLGTLDLGTASATFGGATLVQTNSATANTITIGSGQTLRLNGTVTVGYSSAATSATKLTVSGVGTLTIGAAGAPTNASVQVGNGATTNISNGGTLDMSGLATFFANLGSGTLRIGDPTNAGGTGTAGSTVILAANSTIFATAVTLDSPSGNVTQALKLGSGTNVINSDTITIGGSANRGIGTMDFNGGTGTLQIRNLASTGRAILNVQNGAATTGFNLSGTVNLSGHGSDLLLSTLTVAGRSGQATANGTGTFSFDTNLAGLGLDATTVVIAARTGTTATTGAVTGTMNLMQGAGTTGTATIGTLNMAINSASTATTSNQAKATLNIGGSGTVNITTMTMGNNSIGGGATAQTAAPTEALVSITGSTTTVGTLNMNVNSSANTGTGNTSLATLNVSAGTLNVGAGGILMNTISAAGASGSSAINISGTAAVTTGTAGINMANASNATATGTSTVSITGGTLTMGGNLAYTAGVGTENTTLTLNGGVLDMGGFNIGAATTLVGSGTGSLNFQSGTLKNVLQINGGATLSKTTSGTLILTGTNSYTGLTDVTTGIVRVQSPSGLGTTAGATAVTSGANLQIENVNVGAENITLNGTGTASQGALSGTGTAQNSGTVTLASASSVGVAAPADLLTLSGVVQGSFDLTKVGAGTVTLSGPNTYNGVTNINAGTVNATTIAAGAAAQSLGAGNTVNLGVAATSSGTLNYTGAAATLDKTINALGDGSDTVRNSGTGLLTLAGTVNKNGTTLTLDNGVKGIAVTGHITGVNPNSDLTVTNGTTTLSNTNPFNGATTVTSTGTLAVVAGGTLSGTTNLTVNAGGTALLNGTTGGPNSDGSNIVGTVTGTAPNFTGTAAYTANGGTLALGPGTTGKTQTFASFTLAANSTLDFGTGSTTNTLLFGSLTGGGTGGATTLALQAGTLQLAINNWNGSIYSLGTTVDSGNPTQARLLFNTDPGFVPGTVIPGINFTGFGAGMEVTYGASRFEIVPVPEPTTTALLGAVALCALIRRRSTGIRSRLVRK